MTIKELYNKNRHLIMDGDLILFGGTGIVASIIKHCDNADYSHIGIVFKANGALFIEDANSNGVQADRLSYRVESYEDNATFCILRPLKPKYDIKIALVNLLNRPDKKTIKYDFFNGIKELLNRNFHFNLPITLNNERDICSDFVNTYAKELDLCTGEFYLKKIVFPQDYVRYRNNTNLTILPLIH